MGGQRYSGHLWEISGSNSANVASFNKRETESSLNGGTIEARNIYMMEFGGVGNP